VSGPSVPGSTPAKRPTLLRSLASAVLMDGGGDVELSRETRGAETEWGGVYGQLVRLTGAWRIDVDEGAGPVFLGASEVSSRCDGELWESEHRIGTVAVRQRIAPLATPPGAVRSIGVASGAARPIDLVLGSTFVPFLLPVLVEGIRPTEFRAETSAGALRLRHRGFGLELRWDHGPSRWFVDRGSWVGGRRMGGIRELRSEHEVRLSPGEAVELRLAIVGGLDRELDRSSDSIARSLVDPARVAADLTEADRAWRAMTPAVSFPDAPELERAYAFARDALRQLYSSPAPGLTGLVAGYPWYSAIWCRDVAWMLPALLWLGDFGWVEETLDSVFRYQSRGDLPILGGEPGELPMQISPGPLFLYGTSDTTLYFPEIVLRLARHSGDVRRGRTFSASVSQILAWGRARLDAATGLLRNGGEAEGISAATSGLGRIRYGIDAPDTTIWDSADRRDHAIDVQVLWHRALRAALELEVDPEPASRAETERLAGRVAETIPRAYYWEREGYLYDSIRGGDGVPQLRPNALRAVSAGLVPAGLARSMVARAARDDLTVPWGVRTLAATSPGYRPDAYHAGQVWPIAASWAADAAFSVGEADLAVRYLRTLADQYLDGRLGAVECLRGDRPEPFDACFLLGFSVAPFVSVLFEGLWGLRVDARVPRLEVRPRFPSSWRRASIGQLRVGDGRVGLEFDRPELTVRWAGSRPLELLSPPGSSTVTPGSSVRVTAATPG
jgi:glycogen debranching enzyme